jgi:hypothetical protein
MCPKNPKTECWGLFLANAWLGGLYSGRVNVCCGAEGVFEVVEHCDHAAREREVDFVTKIQNPSAEAWFQLVHDRMGLYSCTGDVVWVRDGGMGWWNAVIMWHAGEGGFVPES